MNVGLSVSEIKPYIQIQMASNWRHERSDAFDVWYAGAAFKDGNPLSSNEIATLMWSDAAVETLSAINGSFAAVVENGDEVRILTDIIASHKVLVRKEVDGILIHSNLDVRANPQKPFAKTKGACIFSLSGSMIGTETIYENTQILAPASLATINAGQISVEYYHRYYPTELRMASMDELEALLWDVFRRLDKAIGDRPIVVPLSAGYDSRLVVSALHALGRRNVICFSYGKPGGFEITTAKAVAEKLNYKWIFVPLTRKDQRKQKSDPVHRAYRRFSDTLSSAPFEQDFLPIRRLLESGEIPPDSVIINGQSGDFITGGHLSFRSSDLIDLSAESHKRCAINAVIKKHYSLWEQARGARETAEISSAIDDYLDQHIKSSDPYYCAESLYEFFEYNNRQSKYVINGQRTYDFFGLDWYLPLWDASLVNFFADLDYSQKYGQRLYRETIEHMNPGDVWSSIPVNKKSVQPKWIRPFRFVAKVFYAPLGKAAWKRFEMRAFFYFMESLGLAGMFKYTDFLFSKHAPRSMLSLFTFEYMTNKQQQSHEVPPRFLHEMHPSENVKKNS
jgi:asparagine synthase (glutamine-hydrolysing)